MAESVFRKLVQEKGLENQFVLDSAGLIDVHEGELADRRMRQFAEKRGYVITHRSRPIHQADFETFDLIVCMDRQNWNGLKLLAPSRPHQTKIHFMTEFSTTYHGQDVPDPYYGGDEGFNRVIDILEESCQGLHHFLSIND